MIHVGKITKKQLLTMERAVSREIEIEEQKRVNHHRVWRNKKAYNRKKKHKRIED